MRAIPKQKFNRAFRRALASDEAYAILGDIATWMSGGCWILAEAVFVWTYGRGQLRAVASRRGVEHVVVQVAQDTYLDGDGLQTERALLKKMHEVEYVPDPYLAVFDRQAAKQRGLICPAGSVRALARFLQERLGDASNYGF